LPYEPGKDLVKGTRLAVAYYGPQSRFAIYEVRMREADGMPGLRYHVADANGITDAEVKEGKFAPIVFADNDPDECEKFCKNSALNI
jgi:hypothetical protein